METVTIAPKNVCSRQIIVDHEDGVIKGMMSNGFRYLNYMPILSKPVSCNPGGTITTNYGCEVYQKPTAYAIMLLGELERCPFAQGGK